MTQSQYNRTIFQDRASQDNTKYSSILAAEYTITRSSTTFATGGKLANALLKSSVNNSFGNGQYSTTTADLNVYAQIQGELWGFSYLTDFSCNYYRQKQSSNDYSSLQFQPKFLIGYNLSENFLVKAAFERAKESPTLSQLSLNKKYLTEKIIMQGNPELKNSSSNTGAILFQFSHGWLDLAVVGAYTYERDPIRTYFIQEDDYISQRFENGIFRKEFGGQIGVKISPFKSGLLCFIMQSDLYRVMAKSVFDGEHSYYSFPLLFSAQMNMKHFSFSYTGSIPGYTENGAFLESDEKISTFVAKYKIKNWSFSASVIGLITGLPSYVRTINSTVIDHESFGSILDNKNMITLGLEYNFSLGHNEKEESRKINNSDRDGGLL